MIPVEVALSKVLSNLPPKQMELLPLLKALGAVLAEEIRADLPIPHFDRVLMDGYAVRAAEAAPGKDLIVSGETYAGGRTATLSSGTAIRVMTGAPLPTGADAVIPQEDVELSPGGDLVKAKAAVAAGDHITRRGEDVAEGATLLKTGTILRPQEIGVIASIGRERIKCFRRPATCVTTTGDELVELNVKPKESQIRNSNAYMVIAQIANMGLPHAYVGIAKDTVESLAQKVKDGLRTDVLIVVGGSGGGARDLVHDVLKREGVEVLVRGVAISPGRHFAFGRKGNILVFVLPGNPVSAFVCFELFVRPALAATAGFDQPCRSVVPATLRVDIERMKERQQFLPANLTGAPGRREVERVSWKGAGDLAALSRANCLMLIPPGEGVIAAGSQVETLKLDADQQFVETEGSGVFAGGAHGAGKSQG